MTEKNNAPPPPVEYTSEEVSANAHAWVEAKKAAHNPVNLTLVERVLGKTIKQDRENKLILFLSMLLNFTSEDQQNVMFSGPSSTGKSWIALEVAKLFPKEDIDSQGYTSPTAFFHELGKLSTPSGEPLLDRGDYVKDKMDVWQSQNPKPATDIGTWNDARKEEKRRHRDEWDAIEKIYVVSLEKRILIFKDSPHDRVLQVIRSLLSHDEKILKTKITDKTKEGGHRTKTVYVIGYPTVIFCSASFSMDEQERTRFWVLSPEISDTKLTESLMVQSQKLRNRVAFEREIKGDTERAALIERIQAIKACNIKQVILSDVDAEELLLWFTDKEGTMDKRQLIPRDQRDHPRVFDLVKAHALLNVFERDKLDNGETLVATREDVEAVKPLIKQTIDANRLGLPPYLYKFWVVSIEPNLSEEGLSNSEIRRQYFTQFNDRLSDKSLKRIKELYGETGFTEELTDPTDKRKTKLYASQGGGEKKLIETQDEHQYNPPPPHGDYTSRKNVGGVLQ